MKIKLNSKLAIVSGSTAGIGLAIARGLAAAGARVVVTSRTEARVQHASGQGISRLDMTTPAGQPIACPVTRAPLRRPSAFRRVSR